MTDRPNSFPGGAPAGNDGGGTCSTVFTPPGKAKRKAIPPHMLVSVAILQAVDGGLRCPLCTLRITTNHKRILEHLTPVAFGGKNEIDNLRFVHRECANKKTNGTKATTAGSDKHMIAKGNRLQVARLAKKDVEKKLTKERWRLKKKLDGTVVRVRTR